MTSNEQQLRPASQLNGLPYQNERAARCMGLLGRTSTGTVSEGQRVTTIVTAVFFQQMTTLDLHARPARWAREFRFSASADV